MKTLLIALLAAAALVVAAVWAYSAYLENSRFIITNAGGGAVYKTDRKTGKTTVLHGAKELEVQPHRLLSEEEQRQQAAIDRFLDEPPPEQVAVQLAKTASTLSQFKYINNERHLNEWLNTQKGDIRISGWSAKKVDDQTYLVTYALVRDGKSEGVRFEVNLAAQLVRNVKGDPALEQKYSVN
jgi:hypothetical protein